MIRALFALFVAIAVADDEVKYTEATIKAFMSHHASALALEPGKVAIRRGTEILPQESLHSALKNVQEKDEVQLGAGKFEISSIELPKTSFEMVGAGDGTVLVNPEVEKQGDVVVRPKPVKFIAYKGNIRVRKMKLIRSHIRSFQGSYPPGTGQHLWFTDCFFVGIESPTYDQKAHGIFRSRIWNLREKDELSHHDNQYAGYANMYYKSDTADPQPTDEHWAAAYDVTMTNILKQDGAERAPGWLVAELKPLTALGRKEAADEKARTAKAEATKGRQEALAKAKAELLPLAAKHKDADRPATALYLASVVFMLGGYDRKAEKEVYDAVLKYAGQVSRKHGCQVFELNMTSTTKSWDNTYVLRPELTKEAKTALMGLVASTGIAENDVAVLPCRVTFEWKERRKTIASIGQKVQTTYKKDVTTVDFEKKKQYETIKQKIANAEAKVKAEIEEAEGQAAMAEARAGLMAASSKNLDAAKARKEFRTKVEYGKDQTTVSFLKGNYQGNASAESRELMAQAQAKRQAAAQAAYHRAGLSSSEAAILAQGEDYYLIGMGVEDHVALGYDFDLDLELHSYYDRKQVKKKTARVQGKETLYKSTKYGADQDYAERSFRDVKAQKIAREPFVLSEIRKHLDKRRALAAVQAKAKRGGDEGREAQLVALLHGAKDQAEVDLTKEYDKGRDKREVLAGAFLGEP